MDFAGQDEGAAGQFVCQLDRGDESGMIFAPLGGLLVYPDELDRRGGASPSMSGV